MTLIRIAKMVINFDNVTEIIPGIEPGSLIVRYVNDHSQTFTGDDAEGLQVFLDKNVRTASKPLEDFILN